MITGGSPCGFANVVSVPKFDGFGATTGSKRFAVGRNGDAKNRAFMFGAGAEARAGADVPEHDVFIAATAGEFLAVWRESKRADRTSVAFEIGTRHKAGCHIDDNDGPAIHAQGGVTAVRRNGDATHAGLFPTVGGKEFGCAFFDIPPESVPLLA